MQKPYTLIIPSWYPTSDQPLNGIFIEKHVKIISSFQNVMVMYTTGSDRSYTEEKEVSSSCIEYTKYYAEGSRLINQLKYIFAQRASYNDIVKKYGRPERIHLHVAFPAGVFVWLLLLFNRIPLVITEHWSGYTSEDGRFGRQMFLLRHITKALFSKAQKVSVVSQYLKKAIMDQGLADAGKLLITSNVLNIPREQPPYKETPGLKALSVGNLNDHEKNITMLIEAAGIVVEKYPAFSLTLVGGGAESQKFIDLAQEKGLLDKNIFFKGYIPNADLPNIYREHHFFVLTSNFETFNIAAAEALLSGIPVVSTQCGGPVEYINKGTGIWIREKTAEDTAAAIIDMIEKRSSFDSKDIAEQMADKYSRQRITDELRNLYTF